jgi:hypothetical protein
MDHDKFDDNFSDILLKLQQPSKFLEGDEYDHMWLILQFLEPVSTSNNQRTITEVYFHNSNAYHVHYGLDDNPVIEEVENIHLINK